jgi:hypothetical protein
MLSPVIVDCAVFNAEKSVDPGTYVWTNETTDFHLAAMSPKSSERIYFHFEQHEGTFAKSRRSCDSESRRKIEELKMWSDSMNHQHSGAKRWEMKKSRNGTGNAKGCEHRWARSRVTRQHHTNRGERRIWGWEEKP